MHGSFQVCFFLLRHGLLLVVLVKSVVFGAGSVELSVSSRVAPEEEEEEEEQELLVYAVVDEGEKSQTEEGQVKPQTQAGTEP